MENENYEKLEGKEIDCFSEYENIKGIVIGCDYNIGITIISKSDHNRYLFCISGPSSPRWDFYNTAKESYKKLFNLIINQIKKGIFDYELLIKLAELFNIGPEDGFASASTCPFGQ